MTIRSDLTIDWMSSPRVITVADTSNEITIQDLVDSCRNFEDRCDTCSYPPLIDAAGKEFLGGTTYVGITAILQNTVLAFKARGGPDWTLCTISGGNLVAIDEYGNQIDPRKPTAFVTVDRTASASATLQEQSALQYASYNGMVTIDVTSGYSGTNFPIGTLEQPCSNLADAISIAESRGFATFYILGDVTFSAGDNIDNYIIIGQSPMKSTITLETGASVNGSEFKEATITGTLDGDNQITDCLIGPLLYVSGYIYNCVFGAAVTIVLGGSTDCHFFNCSSTAISTGSMSTIDCGGSGQGLGLRRYDGEIGLKNKNGAENVSIDLNSGKVILDNTVTNGTIICRGTGKLTDINGNNISSGIWNGATIVNELITTKIDELYKMQGLDRNNPMTITTASRMAGNIELGITGDGINITTVTRQ